VKLIPSKKRKRDTYVGGDAGVPDSQKIGGRPRALRFLGLRGRSGINLGPRDNDPGLSAGDKVRKLTSKEP